MHHKVGSNNQLNTTSILNFMWNGTPAKAQFIKTISYKPALLKEEKNLVNWFLMRKENFKKADKRNALISVNDLFWSTFVQYSACVEK